MGKKKAKKEPTPHLENIQVTKLKTIVRSKSSPEIVPIVPITEVCN